jgi:hypothetical protein
MKRIGAPLIGAFVHTYAYEDGSREVAYADLWGASSSLSLSPVFLTKKTSGMSHVYTSRSSWEILTWSPCSWYRAERLIAGS